MSFSARSYLFVYCMFIQSFVTAYKPIGPVHKKYRTLADKTCLFKKVGCEYIQNVKVQNPQHFHKNPRKKNYYQEYKTVIDQNSKKYAKKIAQKKNAPMYLQWVSDNVGYGVYADTEIKKGVYIGEYTGILRPVKQSGDDVNYAWYYALDSHDGKKLVIDGKTEGNELRFINHAQDPNLILTTVLGDDEAFHLVYTAQKDIPKHKQLTVSYGAGYWDSRGIKPEEF